MRTLNFLLLALAPAVAAVAIACGSSNATTSHGAATEDASVASTDSGGATNSNDGAAPSTVDGAVQSVDAGTDSDASPTNDGSASGPGHVGLPSVVYGGLPLLLKPKVISVTFPNDTMAPQLNEFGAGITQTSWWTTTMAQYCEGDGGACIGAGTDGGFVELTTPPAAEYDDNYGQVNDGGVDLQTFITGLLTAGTLPPNDANSLYMFYMPAGTIVNAGGEGCVAGGFDGYHSFTQDNVVYAIAMECSGYQLSDVTLTAAHETAEAASDPTFSYTGAGWVTNYNDPNNWGWLDESDSEIADLCDDYLGLGQDHWVEGNFTYQRIWSVEAAAANKNPCVPVPTSEVYFNSAPETAFLELNVGESITIEVDGFSDGPTQPWSVLAQDVTDQSGAGKTYTTLSFAGGTTESSSTGGGSLLTGVNNGTKAELTITLTADPTNDGVGETGNQNMLFGEADVMLWSYQGANFANPTAGRYWPLAIMTRAAAMDAGVTTLDGAVPEIRHPHRLPNGQVTRAPRNIKRSFHRRH